MIASDPIKLSSSSESISVPDISTFLILRSQSHSDFFNAEIRGVCRSLNLPVPSFCNSPTANVLIRSTEIDVPTIERLLSRSMLMKSAYELLLEGSYESVHSELANSSSFLSRFDVPSMTFAVRGRAVGRKRSRDATFEYITRNLVQARVDLVNPDFLFFVLEEYAHPQDEMPSRVYVTRFIGYGSGRRKETYSLQHRQYIGNTTMDPELSFIQANIASVQEGDVVLDPFCGTGGLLLAAAEFGAAVLGTEISWKVAKAKGKSSRAGAPELGDDDSVETNFVQQGTQDRFLGIIIGDSSQHGMWREESMCDVLVADPPYGVREKGRKVGLKKRKEHWTLPKKDPSEHQVHIPEKIAYHPRQIFADILDLAAQVLVVGGRLTFWIPIVREEYKTVGEEFLPKHGAFQLMANCEQTLTKATSRRLLLYVKMRERFEEEYADPGSMEVKFRDVVHPANY